MAFYIILFVLVTFFSYFVSFSKTTVSTQLAKFVTLCLIAIPAAIREGIGIDYSSYMLMFDSAAQGDVVCLNVKMELGWYYLNRLVYLMGGTGHTVIAITALLSVYFVFAEIENDKWYMVAPVFILIFYTWIFTSIRQMLVVSMFVFAYQKFLGGQKKTALIVMTISFFFHKSVIFYIPILLLTYALKFDRKSAIIFFLACFVFSFTIFPKMVDFVMSLIAQTQYAHYTYSYHSDHVASAVTSSGIGRIIRYLVYLVLIILFPKDGKYKYVFNLFILYVTFDFLSQTIILMSRLSRAVIFVFLPMAWIAFNEKDSLRQVRMTLYTCCYILLFLLELYGGFHGSIPYRTIFQ